MQKDAYKILSELECFLKFVSSSFVHVRYSLRSMFILLLLLKYEYSYLKVDDGGVA